jgi:very-short-patch-repair endonuclease
MVPRRSVSLPTGDAPFRGSAAVAAGHLSRRQLAGPRLRRLLPDIYVGAHVAVDHFVWCEAAALLLPDGAAIGGWSALSLYRQDLQPLPDAQVEVVVPPPKRLRAHPRLRVRRSRLASHHIRHWSRIPATTAVLTAFDLARWSDLVEAVIGLDALLLNDVVTVAELTAFAKANSALHGGKLVTDRLRLAARGAESPMETRTRLVLVLGGLPEPVVQYEVHNSLGRMIGRLDLAYPAWKVGIEYEGDRHREPDRFRRDVGRLNQLRLAGWTILRFTADDVLRYPGRMVRHVRAVLPPEALKSASSGC